MHSTTVFASYLAILPALVIGHGGIPGAPRLFGRRTPHELSGGDIFVPRPKVQVKVPLDAPKVEARQSTDRCGPGIRSCAAGLCCSPSGYCGTGKDFCSAPDCQFQYGPACDANAKPPGVSTSTVARPKLGDVLYGGAGVYDCNVPGTVALTFDDGPYIYTSGILDLLKQWGAKATFFITGNNIGKGQIDNTAYPWADVIKRAYAEGHQIASHTWSHQDLSNLTQTQRKEQMYSNEMALRNILGFFPTYMRPPYSSCTAACQSDMEDLGYHVTYFDLDTEDYLNVLPTQIKTSWKNFLGNISTTTPANGDWLVIGHDIHEQTAHSLTEFMLSNLKVLGWKAITVGECLGDPASNWYRSSSGSVYSSSVGATPSESPLSVPTSAPTSISGISNDGSCGGTSGFTCLGSTFGNCCSVNGWCGSTSAYCGVGCKSGFGTCGSSPSSAAPTGPTAPTPKPATGAVSFDGTCGGTAGQTCLGSTFGNCCSNAGWCGKTASYCQNGCQIGFGTCG